MPITLTVSNFSNLDFDHENKSMSVFWEQSSWGFILGFHCVFRFPGFCSFSANFQLALNTVRLFLLAVQVIQVPESSSSQNSFYSSMSMSIAESFYVGTINSWYWAQQVLEFQNRYNIFSQKPIYSTHSLHRVFLIGKCLIGSVWISYLIFRTIVPLETDIAVDIKIPIFQIHFLLNSMPRF